MDITFLLPGVGFSGGVKIVCEYANKLQKKGHNVKVIYPTLYPEKRIRENSALHFLNYLTHKLRNILKSEPETKLDWFELDAELIRVPILHEKYIPDADAIIATWWGTAYDISKLNESKGEKFYLIQHYEVWAGPKEEVEATYNLGLHNIVISSWLKSILEKLGSNVDNLILNGIDFNEFYPEPAPKSGKIRVLMPFRNEDWKGYEDGLNVLENIKKRYDVAFIMFGPKPWNYSIPDYVEFHELPVKDELRRLYSSSDIFLFPSQCEGFGLPPIEAMACKVPVVTTNVGAIPDCSIPGETALVSEPGDIKGLTENLAELIENKEKRLEIAEKGYRYVQQFNWDKATDELEKVIEQFVEKKD